MDPLHRPNQKGAATEITPVIEQQTGEQRQLGSWGMEGHAVGPGYRGAGEVAGPQANRPGFAPPFQQIDVHLTGGAGHRRLAAELRGGGGGQSQAVAPGHGGGSNAAPTVAARLDLSPALSCLPG